MARFALQLAGHRVWMVYLLPTIWDQSIIWSGRSSTSDWLCDFDLSVRSRPSGDVWPI